jgi:TolB-like protein
VSSIIEGYNYDIFISYRQKDNKHDGWVTEFIDNLKKELDATFKEEISVYFDFDPQDGLLETHDVDESLKDKLKCLIFIPIISRTYCDQKSFAWENEFKKFVETSSHDRFGLKVKLQNGNIASRILPIRIYDLDADDLKLCESILGGALRCIDFIYNSSGVNRPLTPTDNPDRNKNKTYYRDQINKVANSIKEIITTLRRHLPNTEGIHRSVIEPISVPQKNNKIKIIAGIAIGLAILLSGYFLIPSLTRPKEQLEKSIAILPFRNDSPNDSTTYFLNGVMEEILNNLQMIRDFRVISRSSVEQYRGSAKPTVHEIAKELGVNYIVEGSGQKFADKFVLRIQLIVAQKERHIWGKSYDREIRGTGDIFSIQSEIAQSIAAELNAVITPEEKQLIEKTPTANLTAYDFYQRGREEEAKNEFKQAEEYYHKSLKCDSSFAPAYSGLAVLYWDKNFSQEFLSKKFMDSVLILINRALSYDKNLAEPYSLKGRYYSQIGKPDQAIEEFDKAINLNPNDWIAYWEKGDFYYYTDLVNNINYLQKAASINRGPDLPNLLLDIGGGFFNAGFPDKARRYYQDKLKLDGDSSSYYNSLASEELWLANFNKSIEFAEKVYAKDSTDVSIMTTLGMDYTCLGLYKESLKYYKRWNDILKAKGQLNIYNLHRLAYAYWQNGYKKEAEYYFNEQIRYFNKTNELKRLVGQELYTYYDLAGVYAFRGEKDKAYKNLRIFNKIQRTPSWMATLIKIDPLFNSIRNEAEFQQITRSVEAKYQAEHERVRKWLGETGQL